MFRPTFTGIAWCWTFYAFALLVVAGAGCFGRSDSIDPPDWNPAKAATEAMNLYDKDQDGFLVGPELDEVPSLKKALREIDKDSDQKLSKAEIENRIQWFDESRLGRMRFACVVYRRGSPLQGAEVIFDPEPFVADVIQPAKGVTGANGLAAMSVEGVDPPGVTAGFYKVRVSKKDASGKETIPAKYNAQTTLGQELALGSEALAQGRVDFQLD